MKFLQVEQNLKWKIFKFFGVIFEKLNVFKGLNLDIIIIISWYSLFWRSLNYIHFTCISGKR